MYHFNGGKSRSEIKPTQTMGNGVYGAVKQRLFFSVYGANGRSVHLSKAFGFCSFDGNEALAFFINK